jgi:hypothetical protein
MGFIAGAMDPPRGPYGTVHFTGLPDPLNIPTIGFLMEASEPTPNHLAWKIQAELQKPVRALNDARRNIKELVDLPLPLDLPLDREIETLKYYIELAGKGDFDEMRLRPLAERKRSRVAKENGEKAKGKTSDARIKSARLNGQKGGRPRKKVASP